MVVDSDARISSSHISVYMALLQKWIEKKIDPLQMHRDDIMRAAKISARQTFNKCMNELHEYGYIRYIPASGPFQPGIIYMQQLERK